MSESSLQIFCAYFVERTAVAFLLLNVNKMVTKLVPERAIFEIIKQIILPLSGLAP